MNTKLEINKMELYMLKEALKMADSSPNTSPFMEAVKGNIKRRMKEAFNKNGLDDPYKKEEEEKKPTALQRIKTLEEDNQEQAESLKDLWSEIEHIKETLKNLSDEVVSLKKTNKVVEKPLNMGDWATLLVDGYQIGKGSKVLITSNTTNENNEVRITEDDFSGYAAWVHISELKRID